MKQLVSLLERRCPPSLSGSLRSALSSPGTYVLLHHRFVNLPLPLVPLLHKSLREDLAWAQKNAVRKEGGRAHQPTHRSTAFL